MNSQEIPGEGEFEKPANEELVVVPNPSRLTLKQRQIVNGYMGAHEGSSYAADRRQLVEDFLLHPDQFEPTDRMLKATYNELVLSRLNPEQHRWYSRVEYRDISPELMKDVQVHLHYRYSSTTAQSETSISSSADVRLSPEDPWEHQETGGYIAFTLSDWIKRRTEPPKEEQKVGETPQLG